MSRNTEKCHKVVVLTCKGWPVYFLPSMLFHFFGQHWILTLLRFSGVFSDSGGRKSFLMLWTVLHKHIFSVQNGKTPKMGLILLLLIDEWLGSTDWKIMCYALWGSNLTTGTLTMVNRLYAAILCLSWDSIDMVWIPKWTISNTKCQKVSIGHNGIKKASGVRRKSNSVTVRVL